MSTISAAKCTSRPDCPCDFCVRVRAEIAEGRSEKDKENQLAEDFLRSYLQTSKGQQSELERLFNTSAARLDAAIALLEGHSPPKTVEEISVEIFRHARKPGANVPAVTYGPAKSKCSDGSGPMGWTLCSRTSPR